MNYIFILFIASLIVAPASARQLQELNNSVRALGMGNAYTAVVRDADSLFYNPAGISRASGFTWTVLDLKVGGSGVDAVTSVGNASTDSLSSTVNSLMGKPLLLNASTKTAFLMPYVGIAAYDSFEASLFASNPAVPELSVDVINDYGIALGFGASILPTLHTGVVLKRIVRQGTRQTYGADTLASGDTQAILDDINAVGTGYSMDVGMVFNIDTVVSPAFSFVWKNVGVTKFTPNNAAATIPSDEPEMIIGASLGIDAGLITIMPSFDFKYLDRSDVQIGKKIHLGLEIGLPLIDLRAGFNQGYYSLGVGMSMGLIRLDAATYGVELGEYPGQLEDRRYVLQLTFELGLDANFSITGGGEGGSGRGGSGGRPRLKQRR